MAFHITHSGGAMESSPPLSVLSGLLDELERADAEHGDVSVTHESEWCISVSRSGYMTLEHLERGEPRHLRDISREQILDLWTKLARGDIQSVESAGWISGYR
jgi:hypothetical protein